MQQIQGVRRKSKKEEKLRKKAKRLITNGNERVRSEKEVFSVRLTIHITMIISKSDLCSF